MIDRVDYTDYQMGKQDAIRAIADEISSVPQFCRICPMTDRCEWGIPCEETLSTWFEEVVKR